MKTNAMRILDKNKIAYRVMTFDVDDEHLDGLEVARRISLPVTSVFKTIVTYNADAVVVCLVPVAEHIDLKSLAKASKQKSLEMLPLQLLTKTTGYVRGGCSPLAMKKNYPTYIDQACMELDEIAVSAGLRGVQVVLNPRDLVNVSNMVVGEFVKK